MIKKLINILYPPSKVVEFSYPKSRSFSLKNNYREEGDTRTVIQTIYSNDLAIGMDIGVRDFTYAELNNTIETYKHEGSFTEYKFGKKEGYILLETPDVLQFYMVLATDKDTADKTVLSGTVKYVNPPESGKGKIRELFENKIMKEFLATATIKE